MGTVRWVSKQKKTTQVDTITITADDVTTTYKATIGNKLVSIVGQGTVGATATALYALLAASTEPEFQRITWSNPSSGVIKSTARVAGVPFTVTFAVSGGAGTLSQVHTTANTSPNDVNDGLNWSGGVIPANGDDVIVDFGGNEQSLKYNLGALSGVTLNSFTRRRSFTGKIGLPEINTEGAQFTEYLATELAFGLQGAFAVLIEQPQGDRKEQIKLNTGTTQTTLTIQGDSPGSINNECLWWRGTHASNVVNIEGGSLAVAPVAGNSATISIMSAKGTAVRLGQGVSLTTFNNLGCAADIAASFTTLVQQGGSTVQRGDAVNLTTGNIYSGSFVYMGTGTITSLLLGSGAVADFSRDNRARTVTNKISCYKGSIIKDPSGSLIAAGVSLQAIGCFAKDVSFDFGASRSFAVT